MKTCTRCKEIHNQNHNLCRNCHTIEERERRKKKKQNESARKSVKRCMDTARRRVLLAYSNNKLVCICCNENNYRFLTLDHIDNDGGYQREQAGSNHRLFLNLIAAGFPPGHQVLCFNCNCGRHYNNNICPHEEERQLAIKLKEQEDNEKYSLPLFLDF